LSRSPSLFLNIVPSCIVPFACSPISMVPLSIAPWSSVRFYIAHCLVISLYNCPLPDYPNVPLFIDPSSTAPPSHGLIVPLSIFSVSTVRSKCLSAPLSSARAPHSRIVRCPIVLCLVVPLSIVRVSIVPLSDCPLSPLSHCPTVALSYGAGDCRLESAGIIVALVIRLVT
jgi:hypothetical protein